MRGRVEVLGLHFLLCVEGTAAKPGLACCPQRMLSAAQRALRAQQRGMAWRAAHSAFHPQPSAFYPQPSAFYPQPSASYPQPSTFYPRRTGEVVEEAGGLVGVECGDRDAQDAACAEAPAAAGGWAG